MSKLEMEYDYDTDEEQILRAKKLLNRECIMAIDYFVKDDPLLLVGNLYTDLSKNSLLDNWSQMKIEKLLNYYYVKLLN